MIIIVQCHFKAIFSVVSRDGLIGLGACEINQTMLVILISN